MRTLHFLILTTVMVLASWASWAAGSVQKCTFYNGVMGAPNYVIPVLVSSTSAVVDVSLTGLNPYGTAMVAMIAADNSTYGVCTYSPGAGNDRCGTSMPLTTGGGGGYLPLNIVSLDPVSGTAVGGIKVGSQTSPTHVFIGLCAK